MGRYRVKYYYLATGLEGRADQRSYGIVEAESTEAAIDLIMEREFGHLTGIDQQWLRSCLTAYPVPPKKKKVKKPKPPPKVHPRCIELNMDAEDGGYFTLGRIALPHGTRMTNDAITAYEAQQTRAEFIPYLLSVLFALGSHNKEKVHGSE